MTDHSVNFVSTKMSSISAKVLATGASGYLASHVVQQLMAAGHSVRGTVRSLKNESKVKHLRELYPGAQHPLELVEADLLAPDSWPQAVAGMDYVMHMASPFPLAAPRDENDVIRPAVEGTLNVLKACAKVPSIKRVVLTSSAMAVHAMWESEGREMTEDDWSDTTRVEPYAKSKTLAEKAAWEFVGQLSELQTYFRITNRRERGTDTRRYRTSRMASETSLLLIVLCAVIAVSFAQPEKPDSDASEAAAKTWEEILEQLDDANSPDLLDKRACVPKDKDCSVGDCCPGLTCTSRVKWQRGFCR